jgi:hypothetical protein
VPLTLCFGTHRHLRYFVNLIIKPHDGAGSERCPIHDDEENLATRFDDFFERITKDAFVSYFNFKVLLDPFAI